MRRPIGEYRPLAWLSLCLLCLLTCCPLVHADEQELYDEQEEDEYICPDELAIDVQPENQTSNIQAETKQAVEDIAGDTIFSFLDPQYDYFSEYLRDFTTSVDQYLSNSDKSLAASGSYVRLNLDTYWSEGGGVDFALGIKFKVALPQTQKKLSLIIESDPDETRTTQDLATNTTEQTSNQSDSGVYTGVEREVGGGKTWKISPGAGVRFRFPIDYYVRVRASTEKYFDRWKFSFNQSIYWFKSNGYGEDSTINWDYLWSDDLLFRSSSFLRYTQENKYFDMSQSFFLIQQLSRRRTIAYQASIIGQSEPAINATNYLLTARYRQDLHKNYFFIEMAPQVQFPRDNKFEAEYSFLLRLELFYRG